MRPLLARRAVLLLPLLLAGCGDHEEPPVPEAGGNFPPLRYGYLPPIKLGVQRLQTARDFVLPTGEDEMIGLSPINPVDTLYAMARDRLQPVAQSGTATFRVVTASITKQHDMLNGVLAVRLDVRDGDSNGYVVARVAASHSANNGRQRDSVYDLLKSMMFQMNVELEYQIRNKLKAWVVNTQPGPAPAPQAPPSPPPAVAPETPAAEVPPGAPPQAEAPPQE